MILYADISTLIDMSIFTGIQRVTVEILSRVISNTTWCVQLLHYNPKTSTYQVVEQDYFLKRYVQKDMKAKIKYQDSHLEINQFEKGACFLDIDSSWMSQVKRSFLLPLLKQQGVIIVTHVYDVIPINFPQYCHQQTIFNFMDYITAHLQYSDYFLANAKATLEDLQNLAEKLQLPDIKGSVVPLGADFQKMHSYTEKDLNKKIVEAALKENYVLMVGTIEPRKNHKLLLEAFSNYLKDEQVNIILAGRSGWDMETFEDELARNPLLNKRIFHFKSVSDSEIDYLYKNAFLVAFLSYSEGFGLPIIEAFQKGAPVIASEMKVSREIGGDYCEYFEQDNAKELAKLIQKYLANPEKRRNQIEKIEKYRTTTWDESAKILITELEMEVATRNGTDINL